MFNDFIDKLLKLSGKKSEPMTSVPEPIPQIVGSQEVAVIKNTEKKLILIINKTNIYQFGNVICWSSGTSIDADGSPRAYHSESSKGLDYLANAGEFGNYYGIITDNGKKDGKPVVQGSKDPAPSFYVSPTSLSDPSKDRKDPTKYVDSSSVPYIAIPPKLLKKGVKLGDLCLVSHKDKKCAGIVADIGPKKRIGEMSIAMAEKLIIPSSPRNGGIDKGATWLIFPNSSKGWPRSILEINEWVSENYNLWVNNNDLKVLTTL